MKNKYLTHRCPWFAAATLLASIPFPTLHAATLYWDGTSTTANADGGAGTWVTGGTTNWDDAAVAGVDTAWTNGSDGVFGGTAGTVSVSGTVGAASLTFNTPGYSLTGGTISLTGTPTIATGSNAISISSVLAGTNGLAKSGTGSLTLSGSNTFTGQLNINAGTVKAGAALALGAGGVGNETFVQSGATLDINGQSLVTDTVLIAGSGVGGGGAVVNSAAGNSPGFNSFGTVKLTADATIGGTNGRIDIRGTAPILDLAGFTLTKTGTSELNIYSATSATVSDGNIIVNQGTFGIQGNTVVQGAGTITLNSSGILGLYQASGTNVTRAIVSNGGSFSDQGAPSTINSNISLTSATTTTLGGAGHVGNSITLAGVISGSGNLTKSSSGYFVLTGANTYTGSTTINSSWISFATGSLDSTASIMMNGGGLQWGSGNTRDLSSKLVMISGKIAYFDTNGNDVTFGSAIGGGTTASLIKYGTGKLTTTAVNTFTGTVTVSTGTLELATGSKITASGRLAVGSGTTANLLISGGELTVNGVGTQDTVVGEGASASFTQTGGIYTHTNTTAVYAGDQPSSPVIIALSGGSFTNTGVFYLGTRSTATMTISGGANVSLGSLQLGYTTLTTSANTLNLNGGTLTLLTGGLGNAASASTGNFVNLNGGTLRAGSANGFTWANSAAMSAIIGGSGVTLDTNGNNMSIGQPLTAGAGSGGLSKLSAGTLILTGANTYTGGTTINAGTLLANNPSGSATGNGAVIVRATGTLGGTGTVSGSVTLESGGTLAPGAGIGTLATGDLDIPSGANLVAQINSTLTASDTVNVSGNVRLGGTLTITDIAGAPGILALGTKLTLISYSGSLTGTFNGLPEASSFVAGSNTFKIRYADNGAVTLEAIDGYDSWALSKGLDLSNNDPAQDPDHDGLNNLLEFYLGGNPLGSSSAEVPVVSSDANYLTLTFQRVDAAEGSVTSQVAEYGNDLSGWTDVIIWSTSTGADANGVIVTVAENGGLPDTITVQVPRTLESDGKLFVRLKVSR